MKSTYPRIEDQPAYRAEADKLQRYYEQRSEAQRRIDELSVQLARNQHVGHDGAIAGADELIENEGIARSLREKIAAQVAIVEAINRALPAQTHKVHAVTSALTIEARKHFQADHKRLVQGIVDAVVALDKANKAQQEFVEAARSLGYHDSVLTDYTVSKVGRDINDPDEDFSAFYRLRDMREYVNEPDTSTPDERELHSKRKGKLASLLG